MEKQVIIDKSADPTDWLNDLVIRKRMMASCIFAKSKVLEQNCQKETPATTYLGTINTNIMWLCSDL